MSHVTILDGGTGRELQRIGAPFRQPEWSALALIEAPEFVARVHRTYLDSGADIITTNSYAIVPFHIGDGRFAAEGASLAALSGRLARDAVVAAGRSARVAGSLPPVCGSYRADLFDPVRARPILETLIGGLRPYVDHWQAETLSTIEEAELARELLASDPRPLWLSFTLKDDEVVGGEPRLRSGQSVGAAVRAAVRLGAAAVLFNCSQPEVMGDAVTCTRALLRDAGLAAALGIPIGVYANAFAPQTATAQANDDLDEIRTDLTPPAYLEWARDWVQRGAGIVGGCCGVGPEHIRALRAGL